MSLSFTNNKDEGLMVGSGYQRNYLNFKLNHEIFKNLKLDLASRYTHSVTDGAGTSGGSSIRVGDGVTTRPVNGLADQIVIDPADADLTDDYEAFLKSLVNPIDLTAQDYRKRVEKVFNMNAGLSWTVIKGLTARSELGVQYGYNLTQRYYGPLTGESKNVGGNLPLGEITNTEMRSYRLTNTLTYAFKVNKEHDFTVLAGQEMFSGLSSADFSRSKYFAANLTPEKLFANMALGTQDRHTTTIAPTEKLFSFFGRVNYQYKNRYLFSFTTRADGSSKFAPGNRWGIFPAAAAGWRISEEEFMKNSDVFTELKLRASYGQAGNNRMSNDLWRRLYNISDNRTYGFGDVSNPYWVAASTVLVNPELKWETTVTRNTGLDFTLFNKITGTLDLYWNTTKDLLIENDIPSYTGYSKQMRNVGQTSNRGIELGLSGTLVDARDFQLTASFNIGANRSKIDKLAGTNTMSLNSNWAGTDLKTIDDYRAIVGQTVGLIYGFVTDGYYTSDDFASYNPTTKAYTLNSKVANVGALLGGISVRPGVLKLKDLSGDGTVTADKDRQIIGSALPKYTGGFNLSASWKGIDASVFVNWVVGNDVYNTGKISLNMLYRTTYGNMLNTVNSDNRYKYIDANGNQVTELAALAELNKNAKIWSPFSFGTATPVVHSYAIEDGSFLRLNNITVGYSLPKNIISKAGMTRFRVYATMYNAFLWTKYSGYDPEVSATRNSSYAALTPGVDFSGYPKSRTYTFGLNVTF
jgi:TonB-linked SusC/RagA family outer membrane protein